jgi:hypothetical protein
MVAVVKERKRITKLGANSRERLHPHNKHNEFTKKVE